MKAPTKKPAAPPAAENGPKIGDGEAYLLIAFALIADVANAIPIVNWFVTAVTLPGYQLYFKMKGVRSVWSLGGNLVELIPMVSMLPGVTGGVVATILIDRFGKKIIPGVAQKGKIVKLPQGAGTDALRKAA